MNCTFSFASLADCTLPTVTSLYSSVSVFFKISVELSGCLSAHPGSCHCRAKPLCPDYGDDRRVVFEANDADAGCAPDHRVNGWYPVAGRLRKSLAEVIRSSIEVSCNSY